METGLRRRHRMIRGQVRDLDYTGVDAGYERRFSCESSDVGFAVKKGNHPVDPYFYLYD